ncbi:MULTISPECIES: restriction endonuclease subunit S [unclassified Vibrio]|uniref:restriction endonuclease subunit S n=1 Tax=unclassified Vibrio TaxID=2614977 RepID=UPI0029643051|nr:MULTISPECIES: restriction endonuclease subunit S [unclassified Vibrio]MDW1606827.1 restriction endonuclease subunit S [Vibrio sp. Vb2977]MDW1669724.1 restriction endonuclease subunit S [Vibrio sp. Vb2978]MDW1683871.1 restriction endonuclease subunit S [Vibrio sp. Vb2942]
MSSLPKLRLSEFSDSNTYCLHKFDDMFSFSSGKNIKQNESSPEFSTPCVRYGELYHMYGEVITKTINKTNLEHSELTFSVGNEILLPSAGEDPLDIGSASALTLEGVAIGRTINVLRPKGTIDYSHIYVSYYINEKLRKRISQLARGASISNVYNSDLKTLKAYLPSFPEQQKIASFLSKVDEKIALLTEKKDKLTEYKKGVMQQLFNGKWEKQDGQLTFIPPTLRFKADDGSEFPDWEETKLGDVTEPPSYGLNSAATKYDGLNKYIRITDIDEADRSFSPSPLTSPEEIDDAYLLEEGDIVFARTGASVGKSYLYNKDDGRLMFAGFLIKFSVSKANPKFISYQMTTSQYDNWVKVMSVRSGQPGINAQEYSTYPLNVPCTEEQEQIANFLSALDHKIYLVSSELEKAKEWKKGLLQQMFV